ncbi:MAG: biotin/lipoyl-binding protein [Actinobacteria bacterium]|nr:biotin/lipoyl-binding protein [Actinomycetota bacterium]
MFRKVLIANRGEIARRIMRTCRELDVGTVAVFSDPDADALHVLESDEAVRLGPAPASESYLAIDRIVDAAQRTGAQAVHPGYGFLAENADFARAVVDAGLVFIGPRPETIALMGDKAAAKEHLRDAGVPVIPGVDASGMDDDGIAGAAEEVGYPVLLKAVAGGGGKGMRRVDDPGGLPDAIAGARREAEGSFGDPRLLVERVVDRPRHIEIQVFGDTHGSVVHLFERECSIQRRHQKIIEESPSPALDEELRQEMCDAAVRAAASVDYEGAGTVEMLLSDVSRDFYFLEMNTRLQVEHPVTELITGHDLVAWQLAVAAGEPIPVAQDEIRREGHAIEARLYAEDPAGGFLPQSGTVSVFDVPEGSDVRLDAGVTGGSVVSPHYDPMLAKLIVRGADRGQAVTRMRQALRRTTVLGITTNVDHLLATVEQPAFEEGELTTSFLDDHLPDWGPGPAPTPALAAAAAAMARPPDRTAAHDPWSTLGPWRIAGVGGWRLVLRAADGTEHDLTVRGRAGHLEMDGPDRSHAIEVVRRDAHRLELVVDDEQVHAAVDAQGAVVWVHVEGRTARFEVQAATRHADPGAAAAGDALASPMPGTVAAVEVAEGDTVSAGQTLVVVEAMKMEHQIRAPLDGTVAKVRVTVGDAVDADQPLVDVETDEGA